MKKIEFVRISSEFSGYGFGKGTCNYFSNAEETVEEYIKNGWEYCGYLPLETRGNGELSTISLIFQKEE